MRGDPPGATRGVTLAEGTADEVNAEVTTAVEIDALEAGTETEDEARIVDGTEELEATGELVDAV